MKIEVFIFEKESQCPCLCSFSKIFPWRKYPKFMNDASCILEKVMKKFIHLESEYMISPSSMENHFGQVLDRIR